MLPATRAAIAGLAGVALWLAAGVACAQRAWDPLVKDRLHDPSNPSLHLLQEPARALSALPPDGAGNYVNWVSALERGLIKPRTNVRPETIVRVWDHDVIISKFGSMPAVKFPHRQHTLWLDCSNCHDELFKPFRGANRYSMEKILAGEQCGVCHGAVAFPLTECRRCHSVPNHTLVRRRDAPADKGVAAK